jgi:DNA mismatch repair protein MutS2
VEFDLKTLRPTYHLSIGLPGRSNALAIAERLGLSFEIISNARAMLDPTDLKTEDLLDEIHRQRDLARTARAEAEEARQCAVSAQREWETRLQQIEAERAALLDTARDEARQEAEDLHAEMDSLRRELARARQPIDDVKNLQQELEQIAQEIPEPENLPQPLPMRKAGPLKVGEKVYLRTLKADGVITSLGEEELEVQVGAMRIRANREDIQRKTSQPGEVEKPAPVGKVAVLMHPSPGLELDLRGQTAEEALPKLEDYLDDAYLAGMPYVRIIHGKGTGKLRETIRAELRKSPNVSSWVRGHEGEGGDGVTVVKFRYED